MEGLRMPPYSTLHKLYIDSHATHHLYVNFLVSLHKVFPSCNKKRRIQTAYLSQYHATITDQVTAWCIVCCIYYYVISRKHQSHGNHTP